jgi:hypothetical protein
MQNIDHNFGFKEKNAIFWATIFYESAFPPEHFFVQKCQT